MPLDLINLCLNVENVYIEYKKTDGNNLKVVEGINFCLEKGKRIALIGPSGCGKTSILKALSGILEINQGKIEYAGVTPQKAMQNGMFGLVPQKPALLKWRTVEENISLPLELLGKDIGFIKQHVYELLNLFGLYEYANFYPSQISGGMQSRTAIARALILKPDVLLLDECFGSLDELTRERLYRELSPQWHKLGTSIILVTHSIVEAIYLADRIFVFSTVPSKIIGSIDINQSQPRNSEFLSSQEFFRANLAIRQLLGLQ